MNRLFWKIFAAFWLGMVLFSSATFWFASAYLERNSAPTSREEVRVDYIKHFRTAQQIALHQGESGLKRWLRQVDYRDATPLYLIDEFAEDLLGRPMPEHLLLRLEREKRRSELNHNPSRRSHRAPFQRRPFLSGIVEVPGLGEFHLITDPMGITLARILNRPRVIALPLIIAAISSAFICFLLARYLLQPIYRLQDATRRVAKGDFELKVAESLNNRKDEIGDLARDFDVMTAQLQKLIESQRQLLSDVSHELRSPLARLQVALGLLQKRLLDLSAPDWPVESRIQALHRIELEVEKMTEQIAQVLSLARLDAKSAEINIENVDLVDLLSSIVDDANFEVNQQRVVLLNSRPRVIQAHCQLLTSAIENVIRNAMKYSPVAEPIEVTLKDHTAATDILICDRGPGVPKDKLETIFEAFTRLDEARQTDQGGQGIGLALAKRVMQKHGGSITAYNRPSGGLCVRLRLPFKKQRNN